ncbi:MAG: DUF4164 family protein [Sneathiella sp.]|nr:DUF4164 family protein [Sneathiella sp.]
MGKQENVESRIQAAIARLESLSEAPRALPEQGSFLGGEVTESSEELEVLRAENQALRQEVLELTAAFNGLKQAATNVSGKLDSTIEKVETLLEQ